MALRDASVRGVDGAGNSLAIPLPRRIGLMALQQQQPWFYFHLHEGRHEIKIIQSDEDGYGRFSNLLRVCHYNDVNNNDTQEPLEVRGVGHLRAFICPVTHERLLVAPMPLTTERRLQGTDYNRVDITISHSLITPQNVENRAFDRHLIANTSDVTRRDYYITNSGIIPIDPCIMPACGEPRMIGTGCAGRCAIHIDRCLDCYTERATVAPHGGHPRFCSGCQRVRNARYR